MGYLRHETIVVSGWSAERVLTAHSVASSIFDQHGMGRLVSGLTQHVTNGGAAFFIAPDGSKEGWETSDRGERARKEFITWLREPAQNELWVDWALVLIGGDDGEYRVLDSAFGPEEEADTSSEMGRNET